MSNEVTGEHSLITFCRTLPGATEDLKWGNNLIFSVAGKMFAGFDMPEGDPFSFKVDPMNFDGLIKHPEIIPAPYLARHSWVQVQHLSTLTPVTLEDLIEESHRLVVSKLPKKTRRSLDLE